MLNYMIRLPDDICAKLSLVANKNATDIEDIIDKIVNTLVKVYRLASWFTK